RLGELALGRGDRLLARAGRAGADALDLLRQLELPLARALGGPRRVCELALGGLARARGPALGRLRLGEQLRRPQPLPRDAAAPARRAPAPTGLSRRSPSAIWRACDAPGRPSASR